MFHVIENFLISYNMHLFILSNFHEEGFQLAAPVLRNIRNRKYILCFLN